MDLLKNCWLTFLLFYNFLKINFPYLKIKIKIYECIGTLSKDHILKFQKMWKTPCFINNLILKNALDPKFSQICIISWYREKTLFWEYLQYLIK